MLSAAAADGESPLVIIPRHRSTEDDDDDDDVDGDHTSSHRH